MRASASTPSFGNGDPPGPRGWPYVGVLPQVMWDLLGFFCSTANKYGDLAAFKAGRQPCYLVSNPDSIQHIYQHDVKRYYKGEYYQLLASLLGQGLIISNDDLWSRQRRLLQPLFGKPTVPQWLPLIAAQTHAMLGDWQPAIKAQQAINISSEMAALIQRIIVGILFGHSIDNPLTDRVTRSMTEVGAQLLRYVLRQSIFGGVLNQLPLPDNLRYRRTVATVQGTVDLLIRQYHENPQANSNTVLNAFRSSASGQGASAMDEQQLRDELITLFLAGHDTTAQTLSWTLYFLAQHPELAHRVRQEALRVDLADGDATVEQIDRLEFTERVIAETLRLLPPAHVVSRTPRAAETLGFYSIKAHSLVIISLYAMHHHPRYWERVEQFDPDRFLALSAEARPRYAYFPFGGGPRVCLGRHLAMLEMKYIVGAICQRYRLALAPDQRVRVKVTLGLEPSKDIKMYLEG
jgi:cytochrome P450